MGEVILKKILESAFSQDKTDLYFDHFSTVKIKPNMHFYLRFDDDETGLSIDNTKGVFVNYAPNIIYLVNFDVDCRIGIGRKNVTVVLPPYKDDKKPVSYRLNTEFGHVNFFDKSPIFEGIEYKKIPKHIIRCNDLKFSNIVITSFTSFDKTADKTKVIFWKNNPQNSLSFHDIGQPIYFHLKDNYSEANSDNAFLSTIEEHAQVFETKKLPTESDYTLLPAQDQQYLFVDTQRGKGLDWIDENNNPVDGKVFDNIADVKNIKFSQTNNKLQINGLNCKEFLSIWIRKKDLSPTNGAQTKSWTIVTSYCHSD